jgi:hypothetical protein
VISRRFQRCTQAVRDLEHPKLFENKMRWHLLGVDWSPDNGATRFGPMSYVAGVDVNEALANETG